jgi:hypothetical protein
MSAREAESVVVCEGYHDRAFWDGMLQHLGCVSVIPVADRPRDPAAEFFKRGHYGYRSQRLALIRIVPAGGKAKVMPAAADYLRDRQEQPMLTRLIVNVDDDSEGAEVVRHQGASVLPLGLSPDDWQPDGKELVTLDTGTRVGVVVWQCLDSQATVGVPAKQTLERLVCAALAEVYPRRAQAVQSWLDNRPKPPADSPKAFSWSHMAGWYPEEGGEAFLKLLWDEHVNPGLPAALQRRLEAGGAWNLIAGLAETVTP